MFKRVDRRRKRKEIEESLGLDDDERGVFGLHDTDSSESESDASDSASTSSSSATSLHGHRTQLKNKRKRGASSHSNHESSEDEDGESVTDEEDEKGGGEHGAIPQLTIASALKEPVRLIRPDPEAWVCAFCPGKILKHAAMVKVHEASRIHRARLKRIQELAIEFSPDEDIRSVLAISAAETQLDTDGVTLSHRAERRKAKQVKLKEKRKMIKERRAAVMAAAKAKEATKTTEKESMTGHFSDREEATRASKRIKVESSRSLRKFKNMRPTSFQTEPRRILTKTSRKNKGTPQTLHKPSYLQERKPWIRRATPV